MTNNSNNHINQKVIELVADVMSISGDSINLDSDLRTELDADSMDVVTIAAALSDEFGLEINIDDLPEDSITVRWVVNEVKNYVEDPKK